MIRVQSPHCPNCAAALRFEVGATQMDCEYCEATLILEVDRVTYHRSQQPERQLPAPSADRDRGSDSKKGGGASEVDGEQPDSSLVTYDAPRFRLRILEQLSPQGSGDIFRAIDLGGERFALINLACIDRDDRLQSIDLAPGWNVLVESLETDGDPGLAANFALEELAKSPDFFSMQCAICVLDPRRASALTYNAGNSSAIWWVSTEEARAITPRSHGQALEKADLARRGNHFDNAPAVQLAAQDLIVMASYAFLRDPVIRTEGASALGRTLRENLAEHPQRVVTLAKNAFWESRAKFKQPGAPLAGDLRVAAVGARLAEPALEAKDVQGLATLKTKAFEIAVQRGPGDALVLWPLSPERDALLWIAGVGKIHDGVIQMARDAVQSVLGREGSGDSDNPRAAGRAAVEALGSNVEGLRMLVAHIGNEHGRIKYFTHEGKAGLVLGQRGLRPDSEQQQFGGGGEVSIRPKGRLFFPGGCPYEGEGKTALDLGELWFGGKSSHLYEALRLHWRTRNSEKALRGLVQAVAADLGSADTRGMALITGL